MYHHIILWPYSNVPIGHSVPKWMRKEIERRLDLINRIKLEPKLVPDDDLILSNAEGISPGTLCRMHALDEIQILGKKYMVYIRLCKQSY